MSTLNKLLQEKYPKGAFYQHGAKEIDTLSEKRIRQMCWAIRLKPDWIRKLSDLEIVAKWKKEAKEQNLTEKEIEYVFDEMAYYQKLCGSGDSNIIQSAVEQAWQSDTLIDTETLEELKEHVKILEDVPEIHMDWHPNSNDQVLNLIHPSLYPIVYGHTPLLPQPISSPQAALDIKDFGQVPEKIEDWNVLCTYAKDQKASVPPPEWQFGIPWDMFGQRFLSRRFCWLPTEFMVSEDGSVAIESYINNLHPIRHAKLYPIIANVLSRFVPLLEQVVTDLVHPRKYRVVPDITDWYAADEPKPTTPDYPGKDGEWEEYYEKMEEWEEKRWFVDPQPNDFVAPERPHVPYSLGGRRLQAIVKLSSIQLTPEKPEYEGGSWHVEAMANERIIATGIYYYDVENITESKLSFREQLEELVSYEQGDRGGAEMAYGVVDEEKSSQEIGYVVAEQGRCLVFPNIYQHKVSGFRLKDPSKPGHRKILAFFFIDPSTTIPSTEYVPPQQQDWWAERVMDISNANKLSALPDLVKDNILKYVKFPIPLKEAKKTRLELMEERTLKKNQGLEDIFEPEVSLCEH